MREDGARLRETPGVPRVRFTEAALSSELAERVTELRQKGRTPKEIARALGLKPADVTPIIKTMAAQDPRREAPVAGCWVTEHWSDKLGVTGHPDWPGSGLAAAHEAQLPMRINIVVSNRNAHEIPQMKAIADRFGIPSFEYTNISPIHGGGEVLPSQSISQARRGDTSTLSGVQSECVSTGPAKTDADSGSST